MTLREYVIHNDKEIRGFFGEYRWLSNFWPAKVHYDSLCYNSSENAYQAAKVVVEERSRFLDCTSAESKRLWKSANTLYTAKQWDLIKYDIMAGIVFDKFYRNKDLRQQLLATGDKFLEETNDWKDIYWGVCNGIGANNLGLLLMKVREFWK